MLRVRKKMSAGPTISPEAQESKTNITKSRRGCPAAGVTETSNAPIALAKKTSPSPIASTRFQSQPLILTKPKIKVPTIAPRIDLGNQPHSNSCPGSCCAMPHASLPTATSKTSRFKESGIMKKSRSIKVIGISSAVNNNNATAFAGLFKLNSVRAAKRQPVSNSTPK